MGSSDETTLLNVSIVDCTRPVSNDSVAKLPQLPHATRRLSHGHVDGVTAVWHRVDAIDAKFKLRN